VKKALVFELQIGVPAMSEKQKKIAFFILPILGQLAFTVAAFFLSTIFARHHAYAYVSAFLMGAPVVLAIIMLVRDEWPNGWVIGSLSTQSTLLLVHFAIVHHAIGFSSQGAATDSFWDALYFSVVTWTTLGYGDIQPVRDLRMFAAIEALYGYIFFGLIVGLLSARFKKQ
jgi:hypothetical protein